MRQGVQPPVQVGAVIDGKYRIEEFVGSGAMSVVALAFHLELEQQVAIKFLHALGFDHEQSAQRFKREARAAARIQSEHVARVLDVGTIPEGCPYIVMEHLRGNDLAQELAARGPLPPAEIARYVLEACEALAEAHSAGIVHRDIKPENLFLAERADGSRTVKVLDFGISKSMSQSLTDLALTGTASFMGSPLYMSPEQMRSSRNVDARTDIWSIGTVMYEMLTGRLPFTAESIPELCLAVIGDQPKPLRELDLDLPDGFDAVVERCLEKDRDRRYATVAELARALSPFAPSGTSSAERTGRILALSNARAETVAAAGTQMRLPRKPLQFPPPSSDTLAALGKSRGLKVAMSRLFSRRNVRAMVAAGVGVALGVWWMGREGSTAAQQQATATPELGPTRIAASSPVRVEPVDDAVEVLSNPGPREAPRAESAPSAAPRVASVARVRAARPAPIAVPAASERSPKPAPSDDTPKAVNAWDPSAFGGRY